jgi:hypothetical protein
MAVSVSITSATAPASDVAIARKCVDHDSSLGQSPSDIRATATASACVPR